MTDSIAAPTQVTVGLILKGDSVLMCERSRHKIFPFAWEFPGGKVETGESQLDALKRELKEELAIEIQGAEYWREDLAHYPNGKTYNVHYYLVRDYVGEPVNTEFEQVRFFTREELPSLLHLEGNRRVIELLVRDGIFDHM